MSAADYVESQYIRSESDEDGSEAEKIPMISSGGGKRPKFLSTHATTSWKLWVAVAVIILLLTANATLLSLWLWLPRDLDSTCINHTSAFCESDETQEHPCCSTSCSCLFRVACHGRCPAHLSTHALRRQSLRSIAIYARRRPRSGPNLERAGRRLYEHSNSLIPVDREA